MAFPPRRRRACCGRYRVGVTAGAAVTTGTAAPGARPSCRRGQERLPRREPVGEGAGPVGGQRQRVAAAPDTIRTGRPDGGAYKDRPAGCPVPRKLRSRCRHEAPPAAPGLGHDGSPQRSAVVPRPMKEVTPPLRAETCAATLMRPRHVTAEPTKSTCSGPAQPAPRAGRRTPRRRQGDPDEVQGPSQRHHPQRRQESGTG